MFVCRRTMVLGLLGLILILPVSSAARVIIPGYYDSYTSTILTAPSTNALPVLDEVIQNATLEKTADNKLEIHQTDEKAILHWKSFDIGANAWVHFDQDGDTDWAALNRIYDQNPSQIYGQLTADGRVYLINQNGILFGPGSQINVHSLVGSALNIDDEDFKDGILSFHLENYTGQSYDDSDYLLEESCVSNHGDIETDQGGWVFLLGPQVENSGTISAPLGQVGLAAGSQVTLEYEQEIQSESTRVARLVNVEDGAGEVHNFASGEIISDMGMAGMYGRIVNQNGIIRSVTAVEKDGNIELVASEKVYLGEDSYTGCPVSSSTEKAHESFDFQGGSIWISSHDEYDYQVPTERIEIYGTVEAPSGTVKMFASDRIYMESGSRIDVSGSIVENSASDTVIEAQLNSVEMADDYGQKDGILQGEYITFTTQTGSSIGDVSGYLDSEEKTAGEFSTAGGDIYLTCTTGDIVIKENATIDFSGGGVHYDSGYVETTKLLAGNKIYDISNAPQWIQYDQILGSFEKSYDRFGIVEEYSGLYFGGSVPVKSYVGSYFQGDDAGTLTMIAPQIVLDGILDGSAIIGTYQTETRSADDDISSTTIPYGGELTLGYKIDNNEYESLEQDKILADLVIQETVTPLSELTAEDPIPERSSSVEQLYYANGESVPLTLIGSDILNAAGLQTVNLNVNNRITIEEGAALSLLPGSSLTAYARQFNIDGDITTASGSVYLRAAESYTASEILITTGSVFEDDSSEEEDVNDQYVELSGGIRIGDGGRIIVSGEQVDNTQVAVSDDSVYRNGRLDGGTIYLEDQTDANFSSDDAVGIDIAQGALLEVNGGYQIDPGGQLSGGSAGSIYLHAPVIVNDGQLTGYSLQGYDGGTLEMRVRELMIVAGGSKEESDESPGVTILADNRFSDSGFTHYSLNSILDLTVAEGAYLTVSKTKLGQPEQLDDSESSASYQTLASSESDSLIEIPMEYVGDSSIVLKASDGFTNIEQVTTYGALDVQTGAVIETAPSGSISLQGNYMKMAGTLRAPAGSITLKTTGGDPDVLAAADFYELEVTETGKILAQGVNIPDEESLIDDTPAEYTVLDGGSVTLNAANGDVGIAGGALIDVSGSDVIDQHFINEDGVLDSRQVAGDPGSIQFSFLQTLDLQPDVTLQANGKMSGLQGGGLTIQKTGQQKGLMITSSDVEGPQEDDSYFILDLEELLSPDNGFDSLSIISASSIYFAGEQTLETGRAITLDAPIISAESAADVSIDSPWVTITNTNLNYSLISTPTAGDANFSVIADWIDLTGNITFSGFGNTETGGVSLLAANDIRLSDLYYQGTGSYLNGWSGQLATAADLDLTACRIYPTMQDGVPSDYTLQSGGTLSTHPSGTVSDGPVYSAGGSITILADRINHEGNISAPMGQIVMAKSKTVEYVEGEAVVSYEPADRIYLAPGSSLSTQGETSVYFGEFDDDGIDWFYTDKSAGQVQAETTLEQAPESEITLIGDEVILRPGSELNASGGGELFSYLFLPGVEGTSNPLEASGQYVILPDNSIQFPGKSVYLEGVEGLADGVYQLLPAEYAFMPDALVIQEIGVNTVQQENRFTEEGYQIATGYELIAGTDIQSPVVLDYSVRSADDVLSEGNFTTDSLICGDAGDITVQGSTTIINGLITGAALAADLATDYAGGESGILTLTGREIQIGEAGTDENIIYSLEDGEDISFASDVSDEYLDILSVGNDTLNSGNLGEVRVGDADTTESIIMSEGSSITSSKVTLTAQNTILLNDGSEINAVGSEDEEGVASLTAGDSIQMAGTACVYGRDEIILDTNQLDLGTGSLEMEDGTLTLQSDALYLANEGYAAEALVITPGMWNQIFGASSVALQSRSDIYFTGQVDVTVDQNLLLEASRFVGLDAEAVNLNAAVITLSGIETSETAGEVANSGTMNLHASEQLTVQNGDMEIQGFSDIEMESEGDLTFRGEGSLETGDGNLTLAANRINTTYYQEDVEETTSDSAADQVPDPDLTDYVPADFQINAGSGRITVAQSSSEDAQENASVPGGQLTFLGEGIEIGGSIDLPGGRLTCTSSDGGIVLTENAAVSALGTDTAPGGKVVLNAGANGAIQIADNAVIDVSAGEQGDAGTISLTAPGGGVLLDGKLVAESSGGEGGSLSLLTNELAQLSTIIGNVDGFTYSLDIRSCNGDLAIDTDVTSQTVAVTADSGSITLASTITAQTDTEGGRVELNAGSDIDLAAGSRIDAKAAGTNQDGGTVFLNAAEGDIQFREDSTIDVSGNGTGIDGTVTFRAERQGSDNVRMNLAGTITGASEIQAEAVAVYDDVAVIDSSLISSLNTATQTYMDAVAAGTAVEDLLSAMTVQDRNGAAVSDAEAEELFSLIPGIEVRSAADGDLVVEAAWDLKSLRYGDDDLPGALTLRSAGDLTIEASILDNPNTLAALLEDAGTDSWAIRLTSGADMTSADVLAVNANDGSITIADEVQVYTESADLSFSTGGDLTAFQPNRLTGRDLYLSLGTYDGQIFGTIGNDLNLDGGIIQTDIGGIQLTVDGDVNLIINSGQMGTIRTTGQMPDPELYPELTARQVSRLYWEYSNGGDIFLDVTGDVNGQINEDAWDYAYQVTSDALDPHVWSASYQREDATQGIITMAGGDLSIRCGGDFLGQTGTFGKGDLSIYANGDIDGRFLVSEGTGLLSAMGSIGTQSNMENQTIEIMAAQVWAYAQGHINLGSVVNPTIAGTALNQDLYQNEWELTYTYEGQYEGAVNSAVSLETSHGDIVLTGVSRYIDGAEKQSPCTLLPPVVSLNAGGDIFLQNKFILAPSPTGNLTMNAGSNIYGNYLSGSQEINSWIKMPDIDPDLVYGRQENDSRLKYNMISGLLGSLNYENTADVSLHQGDTTSVSIQAGGDIQNLKLFLSKKAEIHAGNNILDLYLAGQNIHSDDVTYILADNSILYTSEAFTVTDIYKGIKIGGPGLLWISAQNEIDLGTTEGIKTIGNLSNPTLSEEGSDLVVITGYDLDKTESELREFFETIKTSGTEYSNKLAEGDPEAAEEIVQNLRDTVITPFLEGETDKEDDTVSSQALTDEDTETTGDLNMVRSQIASTGNDSDVFIVSKGDLNIGRTTFADDADAENSGIYTSSGGDIQVFTVGDVNVNESRMMTFYGGDIVVWTDTGNINAGRGSKTAISATPATATKTETGEYVVEFKPPSVGSGIRTLTYDPDGAAGVEEAPPAGNVYLFAPSGEIDAGEAGIAGNKVILGAVSVVNVQNISFSQGAVGVPSTSEATATVGALTGGGALSEAGKMADSTAGIQAANKQFEQDAKAMEKTFMPTWLRVQFMGFDIEDGGTSEEDEG